MSHCYAYRVQRGSRSEPKHLALDRQLRQAIVDGTYQPGDRLPRWDELAAKHGVSRLTILKAVARLQRDGMITSTRKLGMFVAQHPPHLHQFGTVLPAEPQGNLWSSFYEGIWRSGLGLEAAAQDGLVRFRFYFGVNWTPNPESLRQLTSDLRWNRLAGVIALSNSAHLLAMRRLLEPFNTPCICLAMNPPDSEQPPFTTVYPDLSSFRERALDHLQQDRRRRVGLILPNMPAESPYLASWVQSIQEHGLELQQPWIQSVHWLEPAWARHVAALMMSLPAARRPDGLIVVDDALTGPVEQGIRDAGLRVGRTVTLVSQCNYPIPSRASDKVIYLGFDTAALLDLCIERLDQLRSHVSVARLTRVPALYAHELPGTHRRG